MNALACACRDSAVGCSRARRPRRWRKRWRSPRLRGPP
jgi:hypothetical protein